jgi:hypothetical protein
MSDRLGKKRDSIVQMLESGVIFTNRKTDFCIELNLCPFMKKEKRAEGKIALVTPKCKSCYAADLLNVSRPLRQKILKIPKDKTHLIETFEKDIQTLLSLAKMTELGEIKRIRFYGLTDFQPDNIPFIMTASKYLICDIISKTLLMKPNEKYLKELINKPNIWISLSFNKNFTKELKRIKSILIETNARNVQLNYCLHTKEENPNDEFYDQFQVFHLRNQDKLKVANEGLSVTRICGLYNRDGNPLAQKEKGAHCRNCSNCHVSFIESQKLANSI